MSDVSPLHEQYEMHKALGQQICELMISEIHKIGFLENEISQKPAFDDARFCLNKDPFTMDENLTGDWFDLEQQRIGKIQFLSDGSFYAEYDIVKPHPSKKQWFVEAVTAWGKEGQIKTEAKLLPIAE